MQFGLECEGILLRTNIPEGFAGNVQPFTIEVEIWTTDEFGATLPVVTIVRDPVNGTKKQELRNLTRTIVDLSYFTPSDDYEVKEYRAEFTR